METCYTTSHIRQLITKTGGMCADRDGAEAHLVGEPRSRHVEAGSCKRVVAGSDGV